MSYETTLEEADSRDKRTARIVGGWDECERLRCANCRQPWREHYRVGDGCDTRSSHPTVFRWTPSRWKRFTKEQKAELIALALVGL